jgi:hypothetical protein
VNLVGSVVLVGRLAPDSPVTRALVPVGTPAGCPGIGLAVPAGVRMDEEEAANLTRRSPLIGKRSAGIAVRDAGHSCPLHRPEASGGRGSLNAV